MTDPATSKARPRVLAVASRGGHWRQLRRVAPAFSDCDVVWGATDPGLAGEVAPDGFIRLHEASRWSLWTIPGAWFSALRAVATIRPDVVVSTGALPGLLVVVAGRLLGARTVWIDSLANVERMSLSGRLVRPFAQLWLTQWPHLAGDGASGAGQNPRYLGSVLGDDA